MTFHVRSMIDGLEEISEPMTETEARAEAINQNGTIADDLEDDGYSIRYLQMVLDGPNGEVAVIDVEPV